jgi:hypothetical protein
MRVENDLVELRAAAARLEGDSSFLASALAGYRAELRVSNQQLAQMLDCSVDALTSLAFCRTPRLNNEKLFLSDVQAIAKYVDCDWQELAKVVRTMQSLGTLKQFVGTSEDQLLKAARDKHGDHNDPNKPKSRKR